MQGFIHPSIFLLDFLENAFGLSQTRSIDGRVVVVSNKVAAGERSFSTALRPSFENGTQTFTILRRSHSSDWRAIRFHLITERHDFVTVAAHLRGHTGHAGTTEAVEHDIPRLGVMEDVAHDGAVRYLGMITVRVINRMVFPFAYICSKRFTMILVSFRFLWLLCFPFSNEISNPRIRTSGVIRRITQVQDVLIASDGKALDLAELRIFQFLRSSSVK